MSEPQQEQTFIENGFGTITNKRVIYNSNKSWFSGGSREDIPLEHVISVRLETSRSIVGGIVLLLLALGLIPQGGGATIFGLIALVFYAFLLWGSPSVVVNTSGNDKNIATGLPWHRNDANAFVNHLRKQLFQAVPPVPNTPLEILVPEGRQLHEAPKLVATTISFLVAASQDVSTIEYFEDEERVSSNNNELKTFLLMVAGANQIENLFSQCVAMLYAPKKEGSLGDLACMQQGNLYSFSVFERSTRPNIKWEIHRRVRPVMLVAK